MNKDTRQMIDKAKNFNQFVNENKGNKIQIADGFENTPYSKSFEEQFNNGEIWFQSSGEYKQLYCLKINKGFIGEVDAMWTLFYKGTYFKPVMDKKNNLMIENDGFKNVKELFDWLNPILKEYKETFKWNALA